MIRALVDHDILLNSLKPIFGFQWVLGLGGCGRESSQEFPQAWTEVVVVVAVIAAEPSGSAEVGLVSRALLALAGFAWPGAAPSVGCCYWHCWPYHCSGCSSCSPSKKCLEKRCINILELNRTPKPYVVIFIYLYLSVEVVDKVPKHSQA
jgi:hypothetical protein